MKKGAWGAKRRKWGKSGVHNDMEVPLGSEIGGDLKEFNSFMFIFERSAL